MRLLQGTVAHFGLSSPRRIQDIVGRLIQTGYLASSPAPLAMSGNCCVTPSGRDWCAWPKATWR